MRSPSELIEAEKRLTAACIAYDRARFTATSFALLLAITAALIAGAAFQMERQERTAAIVRAV
jgi:hypothetical protein